MQSYNKAMGIIYPSVWLSTWLIMYFAYKEFDNRQIPPAVKFNLLLISTITLPKMKCTPKL